MSSYLKTIIGNAKKSQLAQTPQELLDTKQAANYLGVTPRTLEVWRCVKRHDIPYIKVGRLVKYRQGDLDTWLESRMVSN